MSDPIQLYQASGSTASAIASSIEQGVRDGGIAPGTVMPSVRGLAADLGVSPTTIAAAMRILTRRGIVVSSERRRSHISSRPPLAARDLLATPAGVRDLATGNPDAALLPGLRLAAGTLAGPARPYGEPAVLPALGALARAELARDGIPADEICIVGGALDGIERVLSAQLAPGDRVAVEDPGYSALVDLIRALGLDIVPMAIDDRGPIPAALDAILDRVQAVTVTPRGQNPLGAAIDEERAGALRAVLARRPDVLVIEDDHLGAVGGAPHVSLVGVSERWAVVRSVAKSLGPDIRLAYLAGDASTVARVAGRQVVGTGWVSYILQELVVALQASPDVQRLLERAGQTYTERREAMLALLAARGIAATGRSGLQVWIPVRDERLAWHGLQERGWAVAVGERYRIETPPAIRVTTAALEGDDARRFADDLAETIRPGAATRMG
jgi:DNA-binding transcriptional MocR family regulator